jgi:hypothetical protein
MTDLDERVPLTETGVNILLVYGAKLFPPRTDPQGRLVPGIRVTVDQKGTALLEPVGYPCATTADEALEAAAYTCIDAGLSVTTPPPWLRVERGLVVRRPRR